MAPVGSKWPRTVVDLQLSLSCRRYNLILSALWIVHIVAHKQSFQMIHQWLSETHDLLDDVSVSMTEINVLGAGFRHRG